MFWVLIVIGLLLFVKGYNDAGWTPSHDRDPVRLFMLIFFFYVVIGVGSWYFIINIGRFVYSRIPRTVHAMQQTRHEKAELKSLRRRSEIKKLKEELGEDIGET